VDHDGVAGEQIRQRRRLYLARLEIAPVDPEVAHDGPIDPAEELVHRRRRIFTRARVDRDAAPGA